MSSPAHVVKIEAAGGAERALIGGKAWSLQSLLDMGAAVPPACVLTTQAYRDWTRHREPQWLRDRLAEAVGMLESTTGRQFGAGPQGLIVSVRSGAPVSMPGMMDTVLNVGLGRLPPGTEAYLYDARVRFLWQFAELVLDLGQPVLEGLRGRFAGLGAPAMAGPLEQALQALAEEQGKSWPASAMDELLAAAGAVFASWQSSRAKLYRRMRKIDDSIGTAVTIQQMVFGNRDAQSGSGVVFTRNPTSGADGLCGEFLFGGQGEEIVSGRETAGSIAQWRERQPEPFRELAALGKRLEEATGQVHEIEFTLEQGRLYVLQCRPALLTGRAAARVAVDFHHEGRISRAEAVVYARSHGFDPTASGRGLVVRPGERPIAMGLPVGGGVAVGRVAFDETAIDRIVDGGDPVVMIAVETTPKLLPIMKRCAALVTLRGGVTSHAAVVAREIGTPCTVGVDGRLESGRAYLGTEIRESDWITVDGDAGALYAGDVSVEADRLSAEERRLREWEAAGEER